MSNFKSAERANYEHDCSVNCKKHKVQLLINRINNKSEVWNRSP